MSARNADQFESDFATGSLGEEYLIERPVTVIVAGNAVIKTPLMGCRVRTAFPDAAAFEPERKITYRAPGIIQVNGDNSSFKIDGLSLTHASPKLGFLSGIVFNNLGAQDYNSQFSTITGSGCSLFGIEFRNCKRFEASQLGAESNFFGGVAVSGCNRAEFVNCGFRRNGSILTGESVGYGIALTGHFLGLVNMDISILGCNAEANFRKQIDVHCGTEIGICGNTVENSGNAGIYAVSQSKSKQVGNIVICHNRIIQSGTVSGAAIDVGAYEDGKETPTLLGNIDITDNSIICGHPLKRIGGAFGILARLPQGKQEATQSLLIQDNQIVYYGTPGANPQVMSGYPICLAISTGGSKIKETIINRNQIISGSCSTAILAGSSKSVQVTDNLISVEKAYYGVVTHGADGPVKVDGNQFGGEFTRSKIYS